MTLLEEWPVIIVQAAVDSVEMERDGAPWKPNGYPFPGPQIESPSVALFPGSDLGDWVEVGKPGLCSWWGNWTLMLIPGPFDEGSWQLAPIMARQIKTGLLDRIHADDRASFPPAGKAQVGAVGRPIRMVDFTGPQRIGIPIPVRLPLHDLAG